MLKRPYRLKIWKDRRGEFRWRLDAKNGKCISASSEGFKRYRTCRDNLRAALLVHQLPVPLQWPQGGVHMSGGWERKRIGAAFVGVARLKHGDDVPVVAALLVASAA